MSTMPKKLINKLTFLLLCSLFLNCSVSQSSENVNNSRIKNLIEGIPILPSLIENKRDVVEFDSSNGKIISISFDIKKLSKKDIFRFYRNFFKEKKWKKEEEKNIWRIRNKKLNEKIFKIESDDDYILTIKIIIENF